MLIVPYQYCCIFWFRHLKINSFSTCCALRISFANKSWREDQGIAWQLWKLVCSSWKKAILRGAKASISLKANFHSGSTFKTISNISLTMIFDFISICRSKQILLQGQLHLQLLTIFHELWPHKFDWFYESGCLNFGSFHFVGDEETIFFWFFHKVPS